jgi:antitoxin ParD1/3/4
MLVHGAASAHTQRCDRRRAVAERRALSKIPVRTGSRRRLLTGRATQRPTAAGLLFAPHPRATLVTTHAPEHQLQALPTLTDVPDAGTTPQLAETKMPKNTSFILGDHFDAFVAALVSAGRYQSATDVIRSGLRLLEERETRLKALRRALIAGEKSGTAGPLDLAKIKKQARRSAGRKPA